MKLYKKGNQYLVTKPKLSMADEMLLEHGESLSVELKIIDKRQLTENQRKFIFALCQEVSDYSGLDRELFRAQMMIKNVKENEVDKASLKDYSISDGNKLIDIIIEFFIENEIPIEKSILEDNEFKLQYRHIYMMCLKRKCAICSRHADLHHVDAVGMGRDRGKISHLGMRMLPLCRIHHNQAHDIGDDSFMKKYHIEPIIVDEKLEYFIKKGTLKKWKET